MNFVKKLMLVMVAALLSLSAFAHPDELLDGVKGPHGGQLRMAGAYHLELVLEKAGLSIYVMDHGNQAQPIEGLTLRATVISGGKVNRVNFAPKAANQLSVATAYVADEKLQVVVSLEKAGAAPLQAKFQPLKPVKAAPAKTDHSHEKEDDHSHGAQSAPQPAHKH